MDLLLHRLQYWLVAKLAGEPKAMSKLNWHLAIEKDLYRIIGVVQENQGFFGVDVPAGESCIRLAADKLEALATEGSFGIDRWWDK